MMTFHHTPVRITGKPQYQGRGKNRVRVVFLPLGQYPMGAAWVMHSGGQMGNTWHKPAVLKRPVRRA